MMDKMVDVADTVHGTKVSFVIPNPPTRGARNDKYWFFVQSLKPHFRTPLAKSTRHSQLSIFNFQFSIPKTVYWFPAGFGRYHCLFCVRRTGAG